MKLSAAAITGPGKIRSANQDNFYLNGIWRRDISNHGILRESICSGATGTYAVADGMGGGIQGEMASLMAVEMLKDMTGEIGAALLECSGRILAESRKRGGTMGSTFAGIQIEQNQAILYNIGDSRIYRFRSGMLEQLSCDHTGTAILVELGYLTREQARKHPDGHKLTQYLGYDDEEMQIEPYVSQVTVRGGDQVLLCSDGLSDMLTDEQIASTLNQLCSARDTVETLYRMSLEQGGRDNITVLLIRVEEDEE